MTPHEPLPLEISMWRPPTFPHSLTRFGKAVFAPSIPGLSAIDKPRSRELYGSVEEELNAAANRELAAVQSVYANETEVEQTLERERNVLSIQQIKDYTVPVQPRRYLQTNESSLLNHQQAPTTTQSTRYHLRSQSSNAAEKPRAKAELDHDMDIVSEDEEAEVGQPKDLKTSRQAINN